MYFLNFKKNVIGFSDRNMQVLKNKQFQKKQDKKKRKKLK
jgi:hypothetical protein